MIKDKSKENNERENQKISVDVRRASFEKSLDQCVACWI